MDTTSVRASWWSFTLNNPNDDERRLLGGASPPRWLKLVAGQDEIAPGTGTLHIQGYCNTDQVRMSSIKKWLPRAHLKPAFTAGHISNLKTYCSEEKKKNDSFVPGTQFKIQIRAENERMTMADALLKIAENAYSQQKLEQMLDDVGRGKSRRITEELYDREYWNIVEILLMENPDAVALYTQPQYLRAWVKTRRVWIMKLEQDRQTKDDDNLPEQNLC